MFEQVMAEKSTNFRLIPYTSVSVKFNSCSNSWKRMWYWWRFRVEKPSRSGL